MRFGEAVDTILKEAAEARARFPAFNSPHEGLAVIQEEYEELKAEVFRKFDKRSIEKMRKEASHIAAMGLRFMVDLT